jgi:predicted RNA binding protein YcfA (HicA-like mRNA interferase family)
VPKKLGEVRKILRKAGFIAVQAKGSHEKWIHPLLERPIMLSGKDSKDAKKYLEQQVDRAIDEITKKEESP